MRTFIFCLLFVFYHNSYSQNLTERTDTYEINDDTKDFSKSALEKLQGTWVLNENSTETIKIVDSTWTFLSIKDQSLYHIISLEHAVNIEDPNDTQKSLVICKKSWVAKKSQKVKKDDCLIYTIEKLNDTLLKFNNSIVLEEKFTFHGELRKK